MKKSTLTTLAGGLALATAGHFAFWGYQQHKYVHPELRHWKLFLAPRPGYVALKGRLKREPQRTFAVVAPPAPGVRVEMVDVAQPDLPGGLPCYLNLPEHRQYDGAVLWIHGGGHVLGSAGPDQTKVSQLAADLGVPVLSVEYRNAGEAPFPADLDDCYAALRWLQTQAEDYGINPAKIAVAGSSAGGGLAASLVQKALDTGHPVGFQLLAYPMLDDRTDRPAQAGQGRWLWTALDNKLAWNTYLGGRAGAASLPDYAVPARRHNLAGLPAAWISVGDIDLFYAENSSYHQRLLAAGVDSTLYEVPGMYHDAPGLKPTAPVVRELEAAQRAALRAFFEGNEGL
ncbi:alpha/beta hydrolase [Rothia nasimurium]|uniref:alpha/beta hydrolase n=1 Tax=Rothia nasimurium TaxID=85336 RepID=UPI001F23D004|nr:alpha/beta hydrolase [Rothia nasimurium]